jgi:hypothetical protein
MMNINAAVNAVVKKEEKIKMSLLKVSEYRTDQPPSQDCNETECGICYKRIYNKVFICTEPCGKTFHPACMEKMIDQIEENADVDTEEDEKSIEYRCCYCRREFDIQNHDIELFMRHLLGLKAGGYDVSEAIIQAHNNVAAMDEDSDGEDSTFEYNIYVPLDKTYIKKPKQGKRAVFKYADKKNKRADRKMFTQCMRR